MLSFILSSRCIINQIQNNQTNFISNKLNISITYFIDLLDHIFKYFIACVNLNKYIIGIFWYILVLIIYDIYNYLSLTCIKESIRSSNCLDVLVVEYNFCALFIRTTSSYKNIAPYSSL